MIKKCFSTLGCHDRSLEEVLSLAKKYGISALEVRGLNGVLDNGEIPYFSLKQAEETKGLFASYGVKPLILGTTCMFHNEAKYKAAICEGRTAIERAGLIGFKGIRVFGDHIEGNERVCLSRIAEGISRLCSYAELFGIKVYLEVHGEINIIPRLEQIIEFNKDNAAFGLIWDVCHTRKTHPDWKSFYKRFKPYVEHVHFKDVTEDGHVIPGEGIMPLREIADYLVKDGYEGYFSLEWERKWHPELPPIEAALDGYISVLEGEKG